MKKTNVINPTQGLVGYLYEADVPSDSLLVFQLPRRTDMLSETYIRGAMDSLRGVLPEGRRAIVIGADVNIYSIAGEEATALILRGILS